MASKPSKKIKKGGAPMAPKTDTEIEALVLQFANSANSGFSSPGNNIKAAIVPTLSSLANFDGFVARLSNAMQAGGVTFLAVAQELINCVTWDDLVSQIGLNQQ
jgi:hypothetical protein